MTLSAYKADDCNIGSMPNYFYENLHESFEYQSLFINRLRNKYYYVKNRMVTLIKMIICSLIEWVNNSCE